MAKNHNHILNQFKPYLNEMEESPLKTYITERILSQIIWYDKKSIEKQKHFYRLTIAAIILNAVIPIIVILSDYSIFIKIIVAGLSSAAGVINAILSLYAYKDLWIHYRTNCESLQSILHQFFLKTGEFQNIPENTTATNILVTNCEKYFSQEILDWKIKANFDKDTPCD